MRTRFLLPFINKIKAFPWSSSQHMISSRHHIKSYFSTSKTIVAKIFPITLHNQYHQTGVRQSGFLLHIEWSHGNVYWLYLPISDQWYITNLVDFRLQQVVFIFYVYLERVFYYSEWLKSNHNWFMGTFCNLLYI